MKGRVGPTLKQLAPRILLSILTMCFTGELALRSYDALRGKGFFSHSRNPSAQPILPFREFGFFPYQDQNGTRMIASRYGELYPLEKPPGTFRIVCFGGSSTENLRSFETHGIHYPLLIQSILRERLQRESIEVINLGNSAYATPHSLIFLGLDVLSWDPDVVILSHNFNDLSAIYWPNFSFDYSHKYTHAFYTRSARLRNPLLQRSKLYWFFRQRIWKPVDVKPRRRSYGDTPDPRAMAVFRRNLKSFVALARANGIRALLATQPLQSSEELFLRHMERKTYNTVVVYPQHQEFIRHHRAYNGVIKEVAAEEGAWLLDADRLLGDREAFFIDFIHYSQEGVEKLARHYADLLLDQEVIQ